MTLGHANFLHLGFQFNKSYAHRRAVIYQKALSMQKGKGEMYHFPRMHCAQFPSEDCQAKCTQGSRVQCILGKDFPLFQSMSLQAIFCIQPKFCEVGVPRSNLSKLWLNATCSRLVFHGQITDMI